MARRTRGVAAPAAEARILDAFLARRDDVEWDEIDGKAVIAIPKRITRVERFFMRWFPGPDAVFLTLDDLGSEAWRLADGTRRVRDVAAALRERFGAAADPAEPRAAAFAASLVTRGFAKLYEAPRPATDAARGFTAARGYRDVACRRCARAHPIRAPVGARFLCPRCRAVNRVA